MDEKMMKLTKLSATEVARKLIAYRKQTGMTQEELAKKLGVERSTVLRWENEKTLISYAMLRVLVMEGVF